MKSSSNQKSMPLGNGIKGKNIRGRRKRKSHDDIDKPLINDIFNQLVKIPIRVETPDGESMTVSKYYHQARQVLYSIFTSKPQNPFAISVSDLAPELIIMLLDSHRKDYILYRVVERIIENCDPGLIIANNICRITRYPWLFI